MTMKKLYTRFLTWANAMIDDGFCLIFFCAFRLSDLSFSFVADLNTSLIKIRPEDIEPFKEEWCEFMMRLVNSVVVQQVNFKG